MSNTYTVEKKSETKTNSQHSPTIRIQADLFEPTENRYPVFNYQKLLIEEVSDRDYHTLLQYNASVHVLHIYVCSIACVFIPTYILRLCLRIAITKLSLCVKFIFKIYNA